MPSCSSPKIHWIKIKIVIICRKGEGQSLKRMIRHLGQKGWTSQGGGRSQVLMDPHREIQRFSDMGSREDREGGRDESGIGVLTASSACACAEPLQSKASDRWPPLLRISSISIFHPLPVMCSPRQPVGPFRPSPARTETQGEGDTNCLKWGQGNRRIETYIRVWQIWPLSDERWTRDDERIEESLS